MINITKDKYYQSYSVGVIGAGYVGLVVAAVLSEGKHYVHIYDIDENKLKTLEKGEVYISEQGLKEIYAKRHISVKNSIAEIVYSSDIIFVTVGTPSNSDGSINLSYVENVAEELGKALKSFFNSQYYSTKHIILKSTVIPTTTRKFDKIIRKYVGDENRLEILYSPEFLAEGSAIANMKFPDKLVIGTETKFGISLAVNEMFEAIYKDRLKDLLFVTTWENAEMIKYANNAFLSTKISFINQIADICEKIPNCDVNEVAEALGYDHRISQFFLRAGFGYGGSCFTKDLNAISKFANEELNVKSNLLDEVNDLNYMRRYIPRELMFEIWAVKDFKTKTIAILGLSFKPNTDDIRDSPALAIIDSILKNGVFDGMKINVYDPQAVDIDRHGYGTRLVRCPSVKYAFKGADMAIICTEWDEFKNLEPDDFLLLMNEPIVLDGRRVLENPERFIKAGIKYYGIGYGNNAKN